MGVAGRVHPLPNGSIPGDTADWREKIIGEQKSLEPNTALDKYFEKRYATFTQGTRLTTERFESMRINKDMSKEERGLVKEMLHCSEPALAWDFTESGKIRPEVAPPQKIRTVPHTPWQAKSFQVPKALDSEVCQIFWDRLNAGVVEHGHGPYHNPWFLVKKKTNGYRFINSATNYKAVTIRDANIPPTADEFSDSFAGRAYVCFADFFSGYDQVELDEESCDMTAF
jgi:hypothetical protein